MKEENLQETETLEANLEDLPVIPTRDLVLFPGTAFPISLGREASASTAKFADQHNVMIGIVCQKDPTIENPRVPEDLYDLGVICKVLQYIELPDLGPTVLVQSYDKFKINGKGRGEVIPGSPSISVEVVQETSETPDDTEFNELVEMIDKTTNKILQKSHANASEMTVSMTNAPSPEVKINLIATHTPIEPSIKIEMLRTDSIVDRGYLLLKELNANLEKVGLMEDIFNKTKSQMEDTQRQAFLQNQIEVIHNELYGDNNDVNELRKRIDAAGFDNPDLIKTLNKEIGRLDRLNPTSPDYSVLYSYIETLIELPWMVSTPLNTDFRKAEKVLDSRHYGLEKVKERILEQLAVMMNTPRAKAPILCLVGAPGVGKTSLGVSIAEALGRKFRRISLGGLHDEAEIRGHRRTYIGAMPGRIMTAIQKSGTKNPVLMLDEIDKMGTDFKGDPSAALLEVLDPEQNCRFHDNYIDVDFDLSNVLFITTANTLSTISQPLLDRMEIIDISGYLMEEKVEIAKRHFLPKLLEENGFRKGAIRFERDALEAVITGYTSESGVRQLEKELTKVIRKIVLMKMRGKKYPSVIKTRHLKDLLGVQKISPNRYEGNDFAGVVTGLAWTAAGGEILYIESSLAEGKGKPLALTGNLGDVMKESASIAFQYVRAHAAEIGIDPRMFEEKALHIHVPEGATPKDGPSAGITMATSITSIFTGRKVRRGTAMTGEITLRGRVLPVGGIKEKILAAKRAGISRILLPKENQKDIEEIKPEYLSGLEFVYVQTVMDVLDAALENLD